MSFSLFLKVLFLCKKKKRFCSRARSIGWKKFWTFFHPFQRIAEKTDILAQKVRDGFLSYKRKKMKDCNKSHWIFFPTETFIDPSSHFNTCLFNQIFNGEETGENWWKFEAEIEHRVYLGLWRGLTLLCVRIRTLNVFQYYWFVPFPISGKLRKHRVAPKVNRFSPLALVRLSILKSKECFKSKESNPFHKCQPLYLDLSTNPGIQESSKKGPSKLIY